MKFSLLTACLACLAFVACKKPDKSIETVTTNVTTVTVPDVGFSGFFFSGHYASPGMQGQLMEEQSAKAYFSSLPVMVADYATAVKVKRVQLNNDSLGFNTNNGFYVPSRQVNLAPETWQVSGNNGIPDIAFTNTLAFPNCSVSGIPDSISRNMGLQVRISNVSNATIANLYVTASENGTNFSYAVPLSAGNNTIILTSAQLAGLPANPPAPGYPGSFAVITVALQNPHTEIIGGKNFLFVHEYQFNKQIKVRP